MSLRDRIDEIKVISLPGSAVAAFAGDSYHGGRALRAAQNVGNGKSVLEHFIEVTRKVDSVEFACAFNDSKGPSLFHVSNAKSRRVSTLHLGNSTAFSDFQRIRHSLLKDHAPNAIHQLLCGVAGEDYVPDGAVLAMRAMWQLFATRQQRDVGGWVLPYVVYPSGGKVCSYGYSVTDPIAESLTPGSTIPLGTTELGGFAFSLTPLRDDTGLVTYWLQSRRGTIFRRNQGGHERLEIMGAPSEFRRAVAAEIGQEIDIWFKDPFKAPATPIAVLVDEVGRPRINVLRHDNSVALTWVQSSEESFSVEATIPFPRPSEDK